MNQIKIGDRAPLFQGIDQNGKTVKLSDYKGQNVILFFFPKASTPGCIAEACDLQNNYDFFLNNGFAIIGISADSVKRQSNFSKKYGLNYPLITDENKTIINDYGVWGLKKLMGKEYEGILRTTFIVDTKGVIKTIIDKVKTKDHSQQIKAALNL